MMAMSSSPLLTWEFALGGPLLRFVLNKDEGSLEDLSEDQQMVLHDLDSGGVLGPHDDPRAPVALSSVEGEHLPRGWWLRKRCGGEVPDPIGEDELTRNLTRIARDTYCILLSPPDLTIDSGLGKSQPASDPLIGLSQSVTAHPASDEAQQQIAEEAVSWEEVVVESALGRDRLSKSPTPESVVEAAAERWRHVPDGDAHDFMKAVSDCLTDLRCLGAGESIEALGVIGLRGLKLNNSHKYPLSIGTLRSPTADERRYAPFLRQETEVEAVLDVKIELRVAALNEIEPTDPWEIQRQLSAAGRTISLASALARRGDAESQSAVAVAWITEVTPTQGSGAFKPGPISESWVPSIDYGEDELTDLARWVELVDLADLTRVEIAVERLLRAIFEVEAGESLIDAVIAWENLLGTQSETVYRVTAGLSVLCEDDRTLRLARRKELGSIYDRRSRMVHGDSVGADFGMRNRAIQIGLEALARLIERRPELLKLAKSSQRVDRLLLSVEDIEAATG